MKQKGFTLIELVVVIVILGILAATALPKFIDLSSEAVDAKAKGVAGAVSSAGAIYYAQQKAKGLSAGYAATCDIGLVMQGTTACTISVAAAACTSNVTTCTVSCTDSGQTKTATATTPCDP